MIRILHAADLHLDSPFAALSPQKAAARRAEQREVLSRLIGECNDRSCDLLLLAGDLFDSDQLYRETAELLIELLGSCRAKVFIAPGNHDFFSASSAYSSLSWPENVHIFRSERIEAVRLEEPAVTVYGAAFTAPHAEPLLRGFHAESDGRPAVMVVHGELSERPSLYNAISEADVAGSGLDYLALGHIHEDNLRQIGRTTVGNPGCAMGRGFDEPGEKGAFYLELQNGACSARAVPLGAKQYRTVRAAVDGELTASVEAVLPRERKDWILRLILTGTCPAPDLDALRTALAPRFDTVELIDRTQPPKELWADEGEDSLKGLFLRRLHEICGKADESGRQTAALAARIGAGLMEGREVQAE